MCTCLWSRHTSRELLALKSNLVISFSCLNIFSGCYDQSQSARPNKTFHPLVLTYLSSLISESIKKRRRKAVHTQGTLGTLAAGARRGPSDPWLPSKPRVHRVSPRISMRLELLNSCRCNPTMWCSEMDVNLSRSLAFVNVSAWWVLNHLSPPSSMASPLRILTWVT